MNITSMDKSRIRGLLVETQDAFSTWRNVPNDTMVKNLGPAEWYEALTWLISCIAVLSSSIETINDLWDNALKLYKRVTAGEKVTPESEIPPQILFYMMDLQVHGLTEIDVDRLSAVTGLTRNAVSGALSTLEAKGFVFRSDNRWRLSFE